MKAGIEALRVAILRSSDRITEHIKWNASSFCHDGQDRVTFRLFPQDRFQLVFHRGAAVRDGDDFTFEDSTGLVNWMSDDRAVVTLAGTDDVKAHEAILVDLVNRWMRSTSG